MPEWATAVIGVRAGEPFVPSGRDHLLADSALLDAGDGSGHLRLLDRDAWKEALAVAAPDGRTVRLWEALVGDRSAPAADGWYVSTALDLGTSGLDFDDVAVVGAIRRTLASYVPLLGGRFIATTTLMPDWRQCCGALTAFTAGSDAEAASLALEDPWRNLFRGRVFRLERAIIRRVPPPAGPNTQRYGGANPWPGGRFD